MTSIQDKLVATLNEAITPIKQENFDDLLTAIGEASIVLIGEATHGTKEFYETRAEITQQLILKKNFHAVVIEGDWPAILPIHRYVNGEGDKADWPFALMQLTRFPAWIWCNKSIPPFIQWLRDHNDAQSQTKKVGFFGLDLYSLYASIQAVIRYLEKTNPDAAMRAKKHYRCFEHAKDAEDYGYLVNLELQEACVKEAIAEWYELENEEKNIVKNAKRKDIAEHFYATQNARLVKNAEKYYRAMFQGHHNSWNIRDEHMAETVQALAKFLEKQHKTPAKIIVWAHNSHVGDARATEMGIEGELNLGQLLRERYQDAVYNIGFSTYEGTVTAANDWGDPPETKKVQPGFKGSYEELFHELAYANFILNLRTIRAKLKEYLLIPRLQRAIGVIYRPETERYSHYFFTTLPKQFDTIIHLDETTAVEPLSIEK